MPLRLGGISVPWKDPFLEKLPDAVVPYPYSYTGPPMESPSGTMSMSGPARYPVYFGGGDFRTHEITLEAGMFTIREGHKVIARVPETIIEHLWFGDEDE